MTKDCDRRNSCRLCLSEKLALGFSLAFSPLANELNHNGISESQDKFPLDIFMCENCRHVQLLDVVSPVRLFSNYVYVSGTSKVFVNHFIEYAEFVMSCIEDSSKIKVLDIGSNDGTLLKQFKVKGASVLGIDPAIEISSLANADGIETLCGFFSNELSKEIKVKYGMFDVITANNVFAHVDDLHDIILGVKNLLKEDGLFVFEVSYLVDVIEKCLFDTIYHEHLSYHSVTPLKLFFEAHGMKIVNVVKVATHGGSIRVVVQNDFTKTIPQNTVQSFIDYENKNKMDKMESLKILHQKITNLNFELSNLLNHYKSLGLTISGYGLPAKATTMMHEFNFSKSLFSYVVDDNPLKQNKYSPGFALPIYSSDYLMKNRTDVVVIFAWNFADDIIKKLKWFIDTKGIVVIPIPNIAVIGGHFEIL